jgi:hypothetical protein
MVNGGVSGIGFVFSENDDARCHEEYHVVDIA